MHVRLSLPDFHQPPSDLLFNDASPFVTSDFTLADIYGDSIINPNPDFDLSMNIDDQRSKSPVACNDIGWSQTNGPIKLEKSFNNSMDVAENSTFKGELSENSSSNHTSVFLSSEGGPPSATSVNSDIVTFCSAEESNHEATNGVISECNDSNSSDKLRQVQKKNGNGLANKSKSIVNSIENSCIATSTVIKVESMLNNQKVYCERPASPSFPSLSASPQQPRLISTSHPTTILSLDKTGNSIVQLRQSKVKQVLKSVLTTDVADVKVRTPLIVTQGGSPVRKAGDALRVRGVEDVVTASGQQQQLVTLAMTDSFKLRVHGHLPGGATGTAGGSTHDLLGLMHQKTLPSTTLPRDGIKQRIFFSDPESFWF